MPVVDPCLIRSWTPAGDRTVRLGVPLLDGYLDFVAVRCRATTVLATAFDLKVFFAVVAKAPAEVTRGGRRGRPLSAAGVDEILDGARRRAGLGHASCHEFATPV